MRSSNSVYKVIVTAFPASLKSEEKKLLNHLLSVDGVLDPNRYPSWEELTKATGDRNAFVLKYTETEEHAFKRIFSQIHQRQTIEGPQSLGYGYTRNGFDVLLIELNEQETIIRSSALFQNSVVENGYNCKDDGEDYTFMVNLVGYMCVNAEVNKLAESWLSMTQKLRADEAARNSAAAAELATKNAPEVEDANVIPITGSGLDSGDNVFAMKGTLA